MFTSKPTIITLPCPEAKPCNKLFPSLLFLFSFFSQKSHQSQSTGMCTCLQLIPDNLVKRASFYTWSESNNLKYFLISRNFTIKCFTYSISSNKHCPLISTALFGCPHWNKCLPLINAVTLNAALIRIVRYSTSS